MHQCIPTVAAWLVNYMENVMLHWIYTNRCPTCIAHSDYFVELPETPYETRPHSSYDFGYHTSDVKRLESDGVQNINNVLWYIPNYLPDE